MFDSPDIDRIVERHDSDYINGEKNMFVTYSRDESEPDNTSDAWTKERLDAWTEALLGNSPLDKWKREHEAELLAQRQKVAHIWR